MKIMRKQIVILTVIFLISLIATSWAQESSAEDVTGVQDDETNSWWKQRADTNKDGTVDGDELQARKDLENGRIDANHDGQIDNKEKQTVWEFLPSPVTTELEKEFDVNNNGWLEPEEARKLLFRRAESIRQSNGKAMAKTELEKLYDTNGDGIIDLEELKNLREDLK